MGDFLGLGLPIGWGYYPNCSIDQLGNDAVSYDPRCKIVMGDEPGSPDTSPSKSKTQTIKTSGKDRHSTFVNVLKTGWSDSWRILRWLFGVFITGALIGLGGPFWFDVATKLSAIRRKIRSGEDQRDSDSSREPDEDHAKVKVFFVKPERTIKPYQASGGGSENRSNPRLP